MTSTGYAAHKSHDPLVPFTYTTRAVRDIDIAIRVTHCGICHSDLHQVNNEWGNTKFPLVPGHEIVGEVVEVGSAVRGFKVGDRAAVGCYVHTCGSCDVCKSGDEQYCSKVVFTYNGVFPDGTTTYGGYANRMVVEEKYVCRVPESLPSAEVAPLLCAGITLYSPLKHYDVKSGQKVGIIGLGGLGHMGVLFAKEFGCEVTIFSTSPKKEKEAKEVLGAHHFVVSTDPEQIKAVHGQFDVLINTVAGAVIDFKQYIPLLKANGKFIFVGVSPEPHTIQILPLIFKRILVGGSLIGSVAECQEMLNFCAEKKILPIIEKLPFSEINTALSRMAKNDVHYRFVLEHPQ